MEALIVILVAILVACGAAAWYFTHRSRSSTPTLARPTPPARPRDDPAETTAPRAADAAPVRDEPTKEQVDEAIEELEARLAEAPVVADVVVEEIVVEERVEAPPEPDVLVRPSFRDRLAKARGAFSGYFGSVRGRKAITDDTWDELEEALLLADVGVGPTAELLDTLRARVKRDSIKDPDALLDAMKEELKSRLGGRDLSLALGASPSIWLFVGVNGVGKTTTIGKLARREIDAGRRVVLAAGDTFRAAAAEQLEQWAGRAGAELVRGQEGGDPAAVIFDAVERAGAQGADLVLADTAGRLHTKTNLMEELRKVRRVADKGTGKVTEVLLVLDATTGQNGLNQARQFTDAVEVTGVVLTKLDGSAKGGIVLAIQQDLGIPVKLVGLGEGIGDLVEFDADEFVDALFA